MEPPKDPNVEVPGDAPQRWCDSFLEEVRSLCPYNTWVATQNKEQGKAVEHSEYHPVGGHAISVSDRIIVFYYCLVLFLICIFGLFSDKYLFYCFYFVF